jgi:transposase
LYHWRRQYREGRLLVDQKRAQPTPEEAELRRLHEENKRLKLEVEILKKATIYFVKQQT